MYSLIDYSVIEREVMEFGEMAGVAMNPRILRSIIELLQSDTSAASIIQVLNELAAFRNQEKTRRHKLTRNTSEKLN